MCKRVYQLLHISKMACTINLYWIRFVKRYKMDTPIFIVHDLLSICDSENEFLHFCRRRNTYLHLSRDCVLYLINLLTQFHIITNIYINIIMEQYLIYPFSRALLWCINNKLWLIFFSEFNICVTFTLSLDFKIKDVCVCNYNLTILLCSADCAKFKYQKLYPFIKLPSLVINVTNDCMIIILRAYLDVFAIFRVFRP